MKIKDIAMSQTRIYIFFILFVLLPGVNSFCEIFSTSKCFDLLCSPQYIDYLKDDSRFAELCVDPDFIANVAEINSNCSASKLCNLYSEIGGDKDDIYKYTYNST